MKYIEAKLQSGRIPVIIDNTQSHPHPVMETSAELLYLLEKFDSSKKFGFTDTLEQSELIQWLFFWHGSGAPYQGNLSFFRRAQEQSSCKAKLVTGWRNKYWPSPQVAIDRFRKETLRVFNVLELQLSGKHTGQPKEYLAGNGAGKYTIADIGTWAWVKNWQGSGYKEEEMSEFPHLLQWIGRIADRPAVRSGIGKKYILE